MEDNTGGSDSGSIVCSEFSSTPDTSVQSTPEPSPAKKARVDVEPSTSKEVKQSRGKDLTLLMKGNTKGHTLPKDSLYFREMARSKTMARKKTGGPGKAPHKQLATKNPVKKLTAAQACKNAAKANQAQLRNLGNPQTGGVKSQETDEVLAGDSCTPRNKALSEDNGVTHQKTALQLLGERDRPGL